MKIKKGGNWAGMISALITRKFSKHGIKVSINSVEGQSTGDGTTKLHIDADLSLTEAQIIKLIMS